MDKYEFIGSLGEGSFGRVYKAKRISDGIFVALKVISKRGRSAKELKGFRRECDIQRHLHHPNIIQMLDSFETDNEIVVITEFAHKELNKVLGKEGYLSEERVQPIVWDLVSALFYLHSNRVLHRDLKPQNILMDANNKAKLCDFGFARNMSTGTHVLTSIKGTPLYMAPELIEEQPYDYNADLWSLGCIIYELLVGTPPFCTYSILHLIRLIRHEQIQWPTFISDDCISFLKGLLQKNPAKRMTWDQIRAHPFVKGHIFITKNVTSQPFSKPISPNSHVAKEYQKEQNNKKERTSSGKSLDNNKTEANKPSQNSATQNRQPKKSIVQDLKNNPSLTESLRNLSLESASKCEKSVCSDSISIRSSDTTKVQNKKGLTQISYFHEDNHPIETEEWIVFLQKSIQEVMNGEIMSITQVNLANIIVSPLRNLNSSPKVLSYIVKLLSIPLVIKETSEEVLSQIQKVYLEVKLVPNLVNASKLLMRIHRDDTPSTNSPSVSYSPSHNLDNYKNISDLTVEDLQTLQYIYLLICHLVHINDAFLLHFCDSIVVFNIYVLLKLLLLTVKKEPKIVLDVIGILTHLLRKYPENHELVDKILLIEPNTSDAKPICFEEFLRHSSSLLRERSCYFLLFLCKTLPESTIKIFWSDKVKDTLEALMFDSIDTVRNAAEVTVEDLKHRSYYNTVTD